MGGNVAERAAGVGNPALRMVAIGCWAKFRFGGGFAVRKRRLQKTENASDKSTYYPQIALEMAIQVNNSKRREKTLTDCVIVEIRMLSSIWDYHHVCCSPRFLHRVSSFDGTEDLRTWSTTFLLEIEVCEPSLASSESSLSPSSAARPNFSSSSSRWNSSYMPSSSSKFSSCNHKSSQFIP